MNPASPPPLPGATPESEPYHWTEKVLGVAYAVFCLIVGLLLLVFPWTEGWGENYFGGLPFWRDIWNNLYFRGAISGVGVINLYLWILEITQLRRFSEPRDIHDPQGGSR